MGSGFARIHKTCIFAKSWESSLRGCLQQGLIKQVLLLELMRKCSLIPLINDIFVGFEEQSQLNKLLEIN